MSGLEKFGAVVVVLILGIDLYSRWTGQSFGPINLLGQNQLGAASLAAGGSYSSSSTPKDWAAPAPPSASTPTPSPSPAPSPVLWT